MNWIYTNRRVPSGSNVIRPKYQISEDAAYVITPKNVLVNLFLAISSAFSPLDVSL